LPIPKPVSGLVCSVATSHKIVVDKAQDALPAETVDPEHPTDGKSKQVAWWVKFPNPRLLALALLTYVLISVTIELPGWLGEPRVGMPLVISMVLLYRSFYLPAGRRLRVVLLIAATSVFIASGAALGYALLRKGLWTFGDIAAALLMVGVVLVIPGLLLVKHWRAYRRAGQLLRQPDRV
jgi:hypothetical protein